MQTWNRRDWIKLTAVGAVAAGLPSWAGATMQGDLIRRNIPGTSESLPIIGLGSSATFRSVASQDDYSQLKEVIATLVQHGGRVIDTAPSYGNSEEVAGEIVDELGVANQVFWATKLNAVPRGEESADPEESWKQLQQSFSRIDKRPLDLVQVHNLKDIPNQMALLKECKEAGKIRYIGTTYTWSQGYPELMDVMRKEPIDFIGVDYAVDNTQASESVLPLAQELGIGVLVYVPFGRTRLWKRVEGQALPAWAGEIGAKTWAQFFLKFAAAHPAVTCVTPATSKPKHMMDNMYAAYGELPDEAMQQRMIDYVAQLPGA